MVNTKILPNIFMSERNPLRRRKKNLAKKNCKKKDKKMVA